MWVEAVISARYVARNFSVLFKKTRIEVVTWFIVDPVK